MGLQVGLKLLDAVGQAANLYCGVGIFVEEGIVDGLDVADGLN